MAPKGNKRAAAPVAGRPRKAAKPTQQEEYLQAVSQAIEGTAGLPDSCRAMLLALVTPSLGAPADARHPLQAHAVGLVGQALQQARAEKEAAAAAAAERATAARERRAELEAVKAGAEGELELRTKCAQEKKAALEAASTSCGEATAALHVARQAQQAAKDAEAAKGAERDAFDAALREHLTPLREGAWDEGTASGQEHLAALEPALQKAGLDSSVTASLHIVGTKRSSDRTSFDNMVMEQVGVTLSETAAGLQAELAGLEPAVAQSSAEVAAKTAEVQNAEAKAHECKAAFEQAQAEEQAGEEAVAAAARALQGFLCEFGAASEAQEAAKGELDIFLKGPMAAFEALRSMTSKGAEAATEAAQGGAAVAPSGGA